MPASASVLSQMADSLLFYGCHNPSPLCYAFSTENMRLALCPHHGHTDATCPGRGQCGTPGSHTCLAFDPCLDEHTGARITKHLCQHTPLIAGPLPHICPPFRRQLRACHPGLPGVCGSLGPSVCWGQRVWARGDSRTYFVLRFPGDEGPIGSPFAHAETGARAARWLRVCNCLGGKCPLEQRSPAGVRGPLVREVRKVGECWGGRPCPWGAPQKGSPGPTPALRELCPPLPAALPETLGSGVTLTSRPWLPPAWPVASRVGLPSLRLSFPACPVRRPSAIRVASWSSEEDGLAGACYTLPAGAPHSADQEAEALNGAWLCGQGQWSPGVRAWPLSAHPSVLTPMCWPLSAHPSVLTPMCWPLSAHPSVLTPQCWPLSAAPPAGLCFRSSSSAPRSAAGSRTCS